MLPNPCDTCRMDLISDSSSSALAAQSSAVVAPLASRPPDGNAPKRDRRLTLTRIDKRGRLGKRITELTAIFAAAVGGELTPMHRLKIQRAAELGASPNWLGGPICAARAATCMRSFGPSARLTRPLGRSASARRSRCNPP